MVNPNDNRPALTPGLYLIATPIGTARDITLRALDILGAADVIAAEDTRSMRRLMDIHGIARAGRPLVAYHEHSSEMVRQKLIAALNEGKSVVYGAEAGTPMVSDPGFELARAVRGADLPVIVAPGASAALTALLASGLPTDRFFFAGFLPSSGGKRKTALGELSEVPGTLVFYESPHRIAATLADAAESLGGDREAAVCRELTKKFEEILRGSLSELAAKTRDVSLKGEIVLVISRGNLPIISEIDVDSALIDILEHGSVRDAADQVAAATGLKRRDLYQRALALSRGDG
ncbi:16S rRNA (cytidine(1402)-2'-O)-methyltransferase [Aquicoccus sp. G2-2]|uniref:16S rRNA (cytidine(1402)-2'-O)-methyltransferase n=1 Tax=Aquicoccus sp. G2-2 TaxID=3092120 RepID=UPI002ADF9EF9|nr:16S rRNA (cytidine(1402)-2'-O)-methyltransferase [Aquicoccus sp. G2-2]MEA1112418.1 16S rRNA (cytidine(1402)-2'-O)-methyltransferase [Aquicoccus sp. G2-2]